MALTQLRAGAFPSGSVIQTVTTTDLTAGTYSSVDSANPETVISTSITPSATSSKILITGFLSLGCLYSSYTGSLDYLGVRL